MTVLAITSSLSPREREVVRLLRAGKSYKTIAQHLGIHEGTVRTLVERAYRKLGVSSRYELPRV
jgi:RNA polymerase sigma factor (sigma-70 family)